MQYGVWPMTKVHRKIPGLPFPGRQLPARQHGPHAGHTDVEFETARAVADRPVPDADREQRRALADAPFAARAGGDVAHPPAEVRLSGSARLRRYLRFNPWHCIPDHRPLGNQSRARRRMYDELAASGRG